MGMAIIIPWDDRESNAMAASPTTVQHIISSTEDSDYEVQVAVQQEKIESECGW